MTKAYALRLASGLLFGLRCSQKDREQALRRFLGAGEGIGGGEEKQKQGGQAQGESVHFHAIAGTAEEKRPARDTDRPPV